MGNPKKQAFWGDAIYSSGLLFEGSLAKIRNPIRFSQRFGLDPQRLAKLDVLDPILNVDTPLFIDPLLLDQSKHAEMRSAAKTYDKHFREIISLLSASKRRDDPAWRAAERLISYREVKGTCLGYGAESISGSGVGEQLGGQIIDTAKEIIDLGIANPHLFPSMMLFEEDIGADRISDLTTNVIMSDLLDFNEKIITRVKLPTKPFKIKGRTVKLPANPVAPGRHPVPVILVPKDVLRSLPQAESWGSILDAARETREIRERVSRHVGKIWEAETRARKSEVRKALLASKQSFEAFLAAFLKARARSYDIDRDPEGLLVWYNLLSTIAVAEPLKIQRPATLTPASVGAIAAEIVAQFKYLVEKKGLWKELWVGSNPRPEKAAQRIFFAVADSYCKANNLDITPEADSGKGPVDFKFSSGYRGRVLVEIKLSRNPKLLAGYEKQLEAYKGAEQTTRAVYVVIDLGNLGKKDEQLLSIKNARAKQGLPASDIEIIDGARQKSASKL